MSIFYINFGNTTNLNENQIIIKKICHTLTNNWEETQSTKI